MRIRPGGFPEFHDVRNRWNVLTNIRIDDAKAAALVTFCMRCQTTPNSAAMVRARAASVPPDRLLEQRLPGSSERQMVLPMS